MYRLSLLILLTITTLTATQTIDIHDLTNNNGYIPIKIGEHRVIEYYKKVLHIVNITEYEQTITIIKDNINVLQTSNTDSKTLLDTINKNYILLVTKVNNLIPHFKQRRGLVNIIGKGLKFIAGTMDSDDEEQINKALQLLSEDQKMITSKLDNQIFINQEISSQIQNITNHINFQQTIIKDYLNTFKDTLQNRIETIEDELIFMQRIHQIDNDITLLRNHVDDIGQIIFSSKLGIIPTDILTKTELDLIDDYDTYENIKITVTFHDNNIAIILSIPQYSKETLSQILFEPIPNKENFSIFIENNEVFTDKNNNIFELNVKDNLLKNLVEVKDDCVKNIIKFEEANCKLKSLDYQEIKEIIPGILVFKNFRNNPIKHNCNDMEIKMQGTFIIKFENCNITTLNKTYVNLNIRIHEKFILPNSITKIRGNYTEIPEVKLEKLYLKQLNYDNDVKEIILKNKESFLLSLTTDISICIVITIVILVYILIKKHKTKTFEISSVPQSNGGGVIMNPITII